jgi:OmpA-OmpF porin, OOP family
MKRFSHVYLLLCAAAMLTMQAPALAQAPARTANAAPVPGKVNVQGAVPDEATRAAVLAKLRDLYGSDKVVDQITVGGVVAPPNWDSHVQKLLSKQLKQIKSGQLKIEGTQINVSGDVANEVQRQQIVSEMAGVLTPAYSVKNSLRVAAGDQNLLDQTLGNRIIEFESGRSILTPQGISILDEMAAALTKVDNKQVVIIGHTDNEGSRQSNLYLSKLRAEAVKNYLVGKGISTYALNTQGMGPDKPVASNDTPDGKARNRRIEFRVN